MRAVLLAVAMLVLCGTAWGEHAGLLNQWQPQTSLAADGHEMDRRLEQPVHIEILGRAATSALRLLSERTGVSLGVMPEDLDTVGERKLTIIAQGCSLKSLLVQIPAALQECHFDLDASGPQPAYLLHRNEHTDALLLQAAEEDERPAREKARAARETRVAEVRQALAMSPEEVEKLRTTDPLMFASLKDPETRQRLELLLALPEQQMEEFLATGRVWMSYASAPEAYQEAVGAAQQPFLDVTRPRSAAQEALAEPEVGSEAVGDHVWFRVYCYDAKGLIGEKGARRLIGQGLALLPRAPEGDVWVPLLARPLLAKTAGYDEQTAKAVTNDLEKQHDEQERAEREAERATEWQEPQDPQLRRPLAVPLTTTLEEFQQLLARETGLSIVSDYFTSWQPYVRYPGDPVPAWRLLYDLGEDVTDGFEWQEAGDCLVFHHRQWYTMAVQELPESMVSAYREKLKQQGSFTLDNVADAAAELARCRPAPEGKRDTDWWYVRVPSDLREAGLDPRVLRSEAFRLWASLTTEQRRKAEGTEGLRYAEMTAAQRTLLAAYAFYGWGTTHPLPGEEVRQGVFRVARPGEEREGVRGEGYGLRVEFPSLKRTAGVWLPTEKVASKAR